MQYQYVTSMPPLETTQLWQETAAAPRVLRRLGERLSAPLGLNPSVLDHLRPARRIVITGNGAALYAGRVLSAALRTASKAPHAIAVETGVIAARALAWRPGDVLFVVSSSGELSDAVALLPDDLPHPRVVLTADGRSSLGEAADALLEIDVDSQEAVTHTQAYLSNVLTVLHVAAALGVPVPGLATIPDRLASQVSVALAAATDLADAVGDRVSGIAVAAGAGWPTAPQTALLCKEVAGLQVEGLEAREAATTGMYALTEQSVAILSATAGDEQMREADRVCSATGAAIVRLPVTGECAPLELPLLGFPAAIALSGEVGLRRGRNIDQPEWMEAYYRTARLPSD